MKSPLQEEALALQTAAQIGTTLTDNEITFYVDNQVLAQAAASGNVHNSPGHWQIGQSGYISSSGLSYQQIMELTTVSLQQILLLQVCIQI